MSPSPTQKKSRDKRFEEHLETLEQIVHDLESGELPLEDSLERYQLGVESLRQCHRILREVEHRVEVLVADPNDEDPEVGESKSPEDADPSDSEGQEEDAQLF